MSGHVTSESELNAIVHEYLKYTGLARTVSLFEKECMDRGHPVNASSSAHDVRPKTSEKQAGAQTEMLSIFMQGRAKQFFDIWTDNVPWEMRDNDEV